MKTLLTIIIVFFTNALFGQLEISDKIPLEQIISIKIVSVDSAYLTNYDIYTFEFQTGIKIKPGQVLIEKEKKKLPIGHTMVKLCDVIDFRSNGLNLRGHAISSALTIVEEKGTRTFDFQNDSNCPTFHLCND